MSLCRTQRTLPKFCVVTVVDAVDVADDVAVDVAVVVPVVVAVVEAEDVPLVVADEVGVVVTVDDGVVDTVELAVVDCDVVCELVAVELWDVVMVVVADVSEHPTKFPAAWD